MMSNYLHIKTVAEDSAITELPFLVAEMTYHGSLVNQDDG